MYNNLQYRTLKEISKKIKNKKREMLKFMFVKSGVRTTNGFVWLTRGTICGFLCIIIISIQPRRPGLAGTRAQSCDR